MKQPNDTKDGGYAWYSSRIQIGLIVLVSVFVLAVGVKQMLSSPFQITLFGHEILKVEKMDEGSHEHAHFSFREKHRAERHEQEHEERRVEEREVFVVVEQMPELIGGLASIQRAIRYPTLAKKAGIEGRVFVQFIVDTHGSVIEANVVRGIGGGCDEEALRVVRQARFQPGRQRGEAVMVKMSIPITFKLR
jgi:TonB family protein